MKNHQVHAIGDSWTIGKYTEAQMRQIVAKCKRNLLSRFSKIEIVITDHRFTNGWTWLSMLYPGWKGKKTLFISAGTLHYLEADELHALILHEIGHHAYRNRIDIFGGWLLMDILLLVSIFFFCGGGEVTFKVFLSLFMPAKTLLVWLAFTIQNGINQEVEFLCDFFSARYSDKNAMVNALLKMGEEAELTEIVVARTARRMIDLKNIETEDLYDAFEKVRPYGRIFHHNLFRHAAETEQKLITDLKKPPQRLIKPNETLQDLWTQRPSKQKNRIRWRRFDRNRKGGLDEGEITELCLFLQAHPERPLFLSELERNPTTHPRFRDRILLLYAIQSRG